MGWGPVQVQLRGVELEGPTLVCLFRFRGNFLGGALLPLLVPAKTCQADADSKSEDSVFNAMPWTREASEHL